MTPSPDQEAPPPPRPDIPAAFYRDAAPPPRAADDPHWVEFDLEHDTDDLPKWLIPAIPAVLAVILALHGVVAVVLALMFHQHVL